MHHHTQLIFLLLVEMGFYYVGQTDLKLLISSDPRSLASQSAEVTGVSHYKDPVFDLNQRPQIQKSYSPSFIVKNSYLYLISQMPEAVDNSEACNRLTRKLKKKVQ